MKTLTPSRAMISGELSWAFFALCFSAWGSGLPWVGDGWFYRKLVEHASPFLWCAFLAIPATALIIAGMKEILAHRRCLSDEASCWSVEAIEESAMLRGRFCLGMIFGLAYMAKVLLTDVERGGIFAVLALAGCGFMWWFYKENRRVRREIRKRHVPCRVAPAA